MNPNQSKIIHYFFIIQVIKIRHTVLDSLFIIKPRKEDFMKSDNTASSNTREFHRLRLADLITFKNDIHITSKMLKIIKLRHLILLVTISFYIYVYRTIPKTTYNPPEISPKYRPDYDSLSKSVNVLLVTEYRGGSSFSGQIFNQNLNAFYLFEPLVLLPDSSKYASSRANLIKNIFSCALPDPIDAYKSIWCSDTDCFNWFSASEDRRNILETCMNQNVCFRGHSDIFKQRPYCNDSYLDEYKHRDHEMMEICGPVNLEIASKQCASKNIRVMKVNRLHYLEDLTQTDYKDLDFKIIYMVRDPRAIASSRLHIHNRDSEKWTSDEALKSICKKHVENHKFLKSKPEIDKFVLVKRYEDLAMNPLNTANTIYNFLGIPLPESVKVWLENSTKETRKVEKPELSKNFYNFPSLDSAIEIDQMSSNNYDDIRARKIREINENDSEDYDMSENMEESYQPFFDSEEDAMIFNSLYSTSRNSTERVSAWQKTIEWRDVELIQDSCMEFFEIFGYKDFKNIAEVRSMKKAFLPEFLIQ